MGLRIVTIQVLNSYNKIALSEGYAPFVIPKEERTQYMNLLADCDVNGLRNMIERLMKVEIERMKQFNIFYEKTSDKINVKTI